MGDILDWGTIPARVYIYIRRPSLPTVHFYGPPGSGFTALLHSLLSPLDYELREILYDTNKYSNSIQSLTILFLDLGLYPRGFIYTSAVHLYLRSIFTAGVHGFGFYTFIVFSPSLSPLWIHISERFCMIQISILIVYNLERYSF